MKINRQHRESTKRIVGAIKHVHPFKFIDWNALGCDPSRIYIKVYPWDAIKIEISPGHVLVIDLEQGNIKEIQDDTPIIELEHELNVFGPVESQRRK